MPPELEDRVQHLSGAQAARLAKQAGARQVLVTHVAPGDDPEQRRVEVESALRPEGVEVPVLSAAERQTR